MEKVRKCKTGQTMILTKGLCYFQAQEETVSSSFLCFCPLYYGNYSIRHCLYL